MDNKQVTFPNQNNNKLEDLYSFKETLGSGAFSEVKKAEHLKLKQLFAIKCIDKTKMNRNEMYEELYMMSKLNHTNVVKYRELFEQGSRYYVVLELITGGELFDRIIELHRFTEEYAIHVMKQVLSGLQHMHHKNIIHRDIKVSDLFFLIYDNLI
eukprot:TRINITY_DN1915_c2_g2_i3.p1 TRINITY_DN1915_c2_g2~~TRINITY_DN1915_c2_g2_i3.p1  ORF type:complete len:155 (+),score=26.78 TRINITY_DN1915_c2_g2_i3:279-743(+)